MQLGRFLAVQHCVLLNYPSISVLTWVTACASLWIAAIFLGQMGLIASETTTFEVMKRKTNGVDGCTWRGARNIVKFFVTGAYAVSSAPAPAAGSGPACCAHPHPAAAALPQRPCSPYAPASNSNCNNSARGGGVLLSKNSSGGFDSPEHIV